MGGSGFFPPLDVGSYLLSKAPHTYSLFSDVEIGHLGSVLLRAAYEVSMDHVQKGRSGTH